MEKIRVGVVDVADVDDTDFLPQAGKVAFATKTKSRPRTDSYPASPSSLGH